MKKDLSLAQCFAVAAWVVSMLLILPQALDMAKGERFVLTMVVFFAYSFWLAIALFIVHYVKRGFDKLEQEAAASAATLLSVVSLREVAAESFFMLDGGKYRFVRIDEGVASCILLATGAWVSLDPDTRVVLIGLTNQKFKN